MSAPNFNSALALSRPTPEPLKCIGPGHHPEADAKLIARAALAGIELVRLGDGTWLAHKWGMFRPLATDEDADAWLHRVGAPG